MRCSVCGKPVAGDKAKLGIVCKQCVRQPKQQRIRIRESTAKDTAELAKLVQDFWGEPDQILFGETFKPVELPTLIAEAETQDLIIGFVSYTSRGDAFLIVALGINPQFQAAGVGGKLLKQLEAKALAAGKKRLLVATSNDNLPALAFYQLQGFQVFEVKPNVIAEKHGCLLEGFSGIPVRDELRLEKKLG